MVKLSRWPPKTAGCRQQLTQRLVLEEKNHPTELFLQKPKMGCSLGYRGQTTHMSRVCCATLAGRVVIQAKAFNNVPERCPAMQVLSSFPASPCCYALFLFLQETIGIQTLPEQ